MDWASRPKPTSSCSLFPWQSSHQDLQDAVLTTYHLMTLLLSTTLLTRVFWTDAGSNWNKTWMPQAQQQTP
jgi:hypothetical protein